MQSIIGGLKRISSSWRPNTTSHPSSLPKSKSEPLMISDNKCENSKDICDDDSSSSSSSVRASDLQILYSNEMCSDDNHDPHRCGDRAVAQVNDINDSRRARDSMLARMDSNGFVMQKEEDSGRDISEKKDTPAAKYFLCDKIGEGTYGKVYRALDTETNKEYAIKISRLDEDNRSYLLVELSLLKKLQQSPYIVTVHDGFRVGDKLWLVMEHCVGGSILDVMKHTGCDSLSELFVKGVISYLLLALRYLHNHRIIHRDIKASNLVLTLGGRVKLIDFGISAEISSMQTSKNTVIGSPYWMAPEVIEGKDYNEKADIWSLGITILELCEPRHPHFCTHPVSVLFKIVTSTAPELRNPRHYSLELAHFYSRCLQKDPEERQSSDTLLQHAWTRRTVDEITSVKKCSPNGPVEALDKLFADYLMSNQLSTLVLDDEDKKLLVQTPPSELEKSGLTSVAETPRNELTMGNKSHEDHSVCVVVRGIECPSLTRSQDSSGSLELAGIQLVPSEPERVSISSGNMSVFSSFSDCDVPEPQSNPRSRVTRQVSFSNHDEPLLHVQVDFPPPDGSTSHNSIQQSSSGLEDHLALSVALLPQSKTYISRVLSEVGISRANSTSYRSLASFDGSPVLSQLRNMDGNVALKLKGLRSSASSVGSFVSLSSGSQVADRPPRRSETNYSSSLSISPVAFCFEGDDCDNVEGDDLTETRVTLVTSDGISGSNDQILKEQDIRNNDDPCHQEKEI